MASLLPSLHDYYLVSYEVYCERRTIKLHVRHPDRAKERGVPTLTLIFGGVEGYHFKDDAFGNIIFSLQAVFRRRVSVRVPAGDRGIVSGSGGAGRVGR